MPGRQHVDPIDIPKLLPYVRLHDVVGDLLQYKIRLMGTRVAKFYGLDFSGYWYHEAFPTFPGSNAEASMASAVRNGRPVYRNGPPCFFHQQSHRNVERVTLPLATDGRNVDILFIVHTCDQQPLRTRGKLPKFNQGLAISP